MEYFGDESGHFPAVIDGSESIFSMAVVGGEPVDVGRCSRRAVRNIRPIQEAKWNDMQERHKDLFCDCLRDELTAGEAAYAVISETDIARLQQGYRLYNAEDFLGFKPDIVAMASIYLGLLRSLAEDRDRPHTFTFDKYMNAGPSERIADIIADFEDIEVGFTLSTKSKPIQSADCIAGAAAEGAKRDSDWIDRLEPVATDRTDHSLATIEHVLHELNTGP